MGSSICTRRLATALAILLSTACGRDLPGFVPGALEEPDTPDGGTIIDPVLVRIEVSPAALTMRPGDTAQLRVIGVYDDGARRERTSATDTRFSVVDPIVATVTTAGLVRAEARGETEVRVTSAGRTAAVVVSVVPGDLPRIVSIALIAPDRLDVGRSAVYQVTGRRNDGSTVDLTRDPQLRVESAVPGIVALSEGTLVAIAPGITQLEARYPVADGELVAVRTLTVLGGDDPIVGLLFRPEFLSMGLGETAFVLVASVRASGAITDLANDPELELGATGPVALALGSAGLEVTATRAGRAEVFARYRGFEAVLPIEIASTGFVTGLYIVAPATIPLGQVVGFQVIAQRSDGTEEDVTFDPSTNVVATRPRIVDVNPGTLTALRAGVSELIASYLGFDASVTVRVVASDPVVGLQFQPLSLTLGPGEIGSFQVIALYASGAQTNVTFDPALGLMATGPIQLFTDPMGYAVQGSQPGPAQAQVIASFASSTASLPITLLGSAQVTSLFWVPAVLTLAPGNTGTARLFGIDGTGRTIDVTSDPAVQWSITGNIAITGIGPGGVSITAIGRGTATLTGTLGNTSATLTVLL
ncbi:Ig-like domain-containing protein [Myxococcota bacterium]|nr:Ig-like domain-containing protein [Myxococcota bacterium]